MNIFESKTQIFVRKTREKLSEFYKPVHRWLIKTSDEFRALPNNAQIMIYIAGSMLIALLIFAAFFWPMLNRPKQGADAPPPETVAEAIERIDNRTQGNLTQDDLPEIMNDINVQLERTVDDLEVSRLFILKFKTYFNVGQFHDAAIIGNELVDKDILEGTDRFTVYSGLVFAYEQIGDMEQRRHFAHLVVDEFENGAVEDMGSLQYYTAISNGIF